MTQVSMAKRLTLALSITMTSIVVFGALVFYFFTANEIEQSFDLKVEQTQSYLQGTLASLMWNFDRETVARVAQTILTDDVVVAIEIRDDKQNIVFSESKPNDNALLIETRQLMLEGVIVGEMDISFSRASLSNNLNNIILVNLVIWLLALTGINVSMTLYIRKYFRAPLASFTELARSYQEHPESRPEISTSFLEFEPIEKVVKELANDLFKKLHELGNSEAHYRSIFENALNGIAISGPDHKFREVNDAWCNLIGYSKEEMIGKMSTVDITVKSDLPKTNNVVEALTAGEQREMMIEKSYITKSGKIIQCMNFVKGIYGEDGEYLGSAASILDITERKLNERELEKHREHLEEIVEERTLELNAALTQVGEANERLKELDNMKSMFIASVSHELRTPLNSIIGFSGMILGGMSGDLNEEQLDGIGRINRSGKHLLDLISDIINISKIEAGRVAISPQEVSLEELVKQAVDDIQPLIEPKGIKVKYNVASWPTLYTDRKYLLQCLHNYLSNAAKYTKKGSITISVDEKDDMVEIAVADTGIGIAKADFTKLFYPFERLDSDLRIQAGGTGLGLHVVKKIVTEILGGKVSVKSKLGKGSTFYIQISKKIDAKVINGDGKSKK